MALPFAAHPVVRGEFTRRWARVRWAVHGGFAASSIASVVALFVVPWDGAATWGVALVVLGGVPLITFTVAHLNLRFPGWWAPFMIALGVLQALGVGATTGHWVLAGGVAVVAVGGALLAAAGRRTLYGKGDGQVLGTTLGVRSASRSVRGQTGRVHVGHATFDGEHLRWSVGRTPAGLDPGGRIPLRDITFVAVVDTLDGAVLVVRTRTGETHAVIGEPHLFAQLLDQRLRMLTHPGWST